MTSATRSLCGPPRRASSSELARHRWCPAHVRLSHPRAEPLRPARSRSRRALENAVVSDRPLDMAVSAFSPGAQIVRDGLLHTAVGFAHYEVKGKARVSGGPARSRASGWGLRRVQDDLRQAAGRTVPGVRRRAAPVRPVPAARVPHLIPAKGLRRLHRHREPRRHPGAVRGGRRAGPAPRSRRSRWRSTSRRRFSRSTTTAATSSLSGGSPTDLSWYPMTPCFR